MFIRSTSYCVCLFLFVASRALGQHALDSSSCGNVKEVFTKRVGPADNVPATPIPDTILSECSGTLKYTGGSSCCTADMESKFLDASEEYLREHIRISNKKLKTRITDSLVYYQEHLQKSVEESYTKISDMLASLYNIPKEVHKEALDDVFDQMNKYLMGQDGIPVADIIGHFFTKLFPSVFEYVLSDPTKASQTGEDFAKCLMENHEEVEPFGNVPKHLGRRLKHAFQRARIFTETMKVMIEAIDSTDNVVVDNACKKAVSRLQFCSMCSGQVEVQPCRGFCLNVMRGCLSKISEISSSWDDLVVEFQNLEMGMFRQNNAQELLSYLNGNISEALLQAMDDGPRIYNDVMALCRETSQTKSENDMMFKRFSTPEGLQPSHPSSRIQSIRKDIKALMEQLNDSKGFFQRIADGLCRIDVIYDMDMQSDRCWNGSTVGRYMQPVPEANIISQVQHNTEVKVTLIPDRNLIEVKDTLAHMRRNLAALLNEELMLSDQSYRTVEGSAGGSSMSGRDVIIDDEDFMEGVSGSGSGQGSEDLEPEEVDKPTVTARPDGDGGRTGGGGGGVIKPGDKKGDSGNKGGSGGRREGGPGGSAAISLSSFTLLCVCAILARLHTVL